MTGTIQGKNAILMFDKNGYLPFLCASDISITLSSDVLPIRARTIAGKGHWKMVTYQNASYSITLSGLLKFDNAKFTSWDLIDNWLNFAHVGFRITFTDDQSNQKSMQGYVMVKSNTIGISAGAVVKTDLALEGNGELKIFDGLIPCSAVISTITVTGQTAVDGITHIAYTYTGAPYQIKYRIDGTGSYIYALVDQPLAIPSLTNGSHDVEIIPVCSNSYEGTGADIAFVVTRGLTCPSIISDITITSTSATPVYSGTPLSMKFRIDGGIWVDEPITFVIPLGGLSAGAHTIEIVPICSNNVEGTGFIKSFTVASQPAQSVINWVMSSFVGGNTLQVFINGVLNVNQTTGSGSITVATGSSVRVVLVGNANPGSRMNLRTTDSTITFILDDRTSLCPSTIQYTFTANGDTYAINATITP